jgi:hypothetical protein
MQALTYYLNTHTQSLSDNPYATGCLSGSITFWRHSGKSSPLVDLALSAVALVVYSKTHQHPAAAEEGAQIYYQLLRTVQGRIQDLSTIQDFDAWLLIIRLMGRYEGAIRGPGDFNLPEPPLNQLRNWAHHDGAQAVLKLWHDRGISRPATYIMNQARKGLIRIAFLRGVPLPTWMIDGACFGEEGFDLEYDRVETRLANLRHATIRLEQGETVESNEIEKLNNQAQDLDQALQDWASQIPSKYFYKTHLIIEAGPYYNTSLFSPMVYSFSKLRHAAPWLQYFSTRMLIISTRLRILKSIQQNDDVYRKQKEDCNAIMKTMANGIASTLPFVLGRFKIQAPGQTLVSVSDKEEIQPYQAMVVVWSLAIASGAKGVVEEHQLWFRSRLSMLGRILGDGVIESAESEIWISF